MVLLQSSRRYAVCLAEARPVYYTAVSYCWGDPNLTHAMNCRGRRKGITESLDVALRHLRHAECQVNLWVDQICIDQDDVAEKGQQVQLMGLIYQRAMNTVIWLGPKSDHGAFRALESVWHIIRYWNDNVSEEERTRLRRSLEDEHILQSLQDLFERPWFGRLWIIQEAVFSFQPYFMTGRNAISWSDLTKCCSEFVEHEIFGSHQLTDASTSSQALAARGCSIGAELYNMKIDFENKASLLNRLIDTREAAATDPRDHVYGLLGLSRSTIIPDYSKCTHQLYSDATVEYINHEVDAYANIRASGRELRVSNLHGVFRALFCVDHEQQHAILPSWVPDWSRPRHTESLAIKLSSGVCYATGGVARSDVLVVHPDMKSITVTVRLFDTLKRLDQVLMRGMVQADGENRALRQCAEFVTSHCHPYPSECSTFTAFWQTLVVGKDGPGMQRCPVAYAEIVSLLLGGHSDQPKIPDQTYTDRQVKGRLTLKRPKSRNTGRVYRDLRIASSKAVHFRRLAATTQRYLGLVPRFAEEGYWIVVAPGCPVPLVVRRRPDGTFTFIGECYVHGIMNGEIANMPICQICHRRPRSDSCEQFTTRVAMSQDFAMLIC